MKISPQKKARDQAYAQFSRQKFSELKEKHPLKTDQQIESMVKKQWKATNAKTNTRQKKSSNSAQNGVQGQLILSEVVQEEKEDPVKKKLEYEDGQVSRIAVKQQLLEEISSVKSSVNKTATKKKKAIRRSRKETEYIKFFKTYYSNLHREHPKWNQQQITTIIKLLWKKKNIINGKGRKPTPTPKPKHTRPLKPCSGRKLFGIDKRRVYKMITAQDIQARWNILPKQTRKYWSQLGANGGVVVTPVKSQTTTIKNSPGEKIRLEFSSSPIKINNPFSFMNAVM